ncbi:hypothetical protein ACWNYA_00540 [Candidatus Karelsulcia muelleri]
MIISSRKNNLIKFISKLKKKKYRISTNLFLVEGEKEICLALKANFVLKYVLVCKEICNCNLEIYSKYININNILNIKKLIFKKIAYRKKTGGILAIF